MNGRPCALVTGASAGIGAAFAERLAQDGHHLVLVARRRDRLEALAVRLRESAGVAVEVLAADLSNRDGLLAVERRIAAEPALAILVNNAGYGAYKPFVELAADEAQSLIDLQVTAVTRLCRAALPGMVARAGGAIVNVSSRLAWSAALDTPHLPRRAVYAASKAYLNTFSQILAGELAGTGVRVQVLCPGVVRTEFHESQGIDPARFPPAIVMSPEDVVTASLAGLQMGEVVCVPALQDPETLDAFRQAEADLLADPSGALAARYSRGA